MSFRTAALALSAAVVATAAHAGEPADRAEAAEWTVRVGDLAGQGTATQVDLHVAARAGYHVNLEYPMAFLAAPGATVAFATPRVPLRPAAPAPCEGRPQETCAVMLSLPLALPQNGPARLEGTLAFSVCSPERCLIEKVALRATLARR